MQQWPVETTACFMAPFEWLLPLEPQARAIVSSFFEMPLFDCRFLSCLRERMKIPVRGGCGLY